tara:strand:+ start:316 stop:789 length:474 start_codon:yes stop_codon:yes gene_type:complete
MAFKMESPFKKIEELQKVVEELKGASKKHAGQAKAVESYINKQSSSPAKAIPPELIKLGIKLGTSALAGIGGSMKEKAEEKKEKSKEEITEGGLVGAERRISKAKTEGTPAKKKGTKDACYYKVKRKVKVWPSAYASGQLVQCRKRGAANYGKSSKK